MLDVAETAGPGDRLHTLLLAMTGRVDDDAVNGTRELLGMAQLDTAAHFLTGCLLAGRIPVSTNEQYHLRRALHELHADAGLAERLSVVQERQDATHRFDLRAAESDWDVSATLAPIANRLVGLRGLWTTWRTTPAGDSYGAVPRRVLLAEVGADGSTAAVGYQLLEALRRADVACSVDVFASGMELPEYHREALAAASRLHLETTPSHGDDSVRMPEQVVTATVEPAAHSSPRDPAGMARASARESDTESAPPPATSVPTPADSAPAPAQEASDAYATSPVAVEADTAVLADPSPTEASSGAWSAEPQLAEQVEPEPAFPVATPLDTSARQEDATSREQALRERREEELREQARREEELREEAMRAGLDSEVSVSELPAEEPGGGHETGAADGATGSDEKSGSVRVPPAVDAKLTDRERNLLRKLHEELAQREQDRTSEQPVAASGPGSAAQAQEAWPSAASHGTGGFPPINVPGR